MSMDIEWKLLYVLRAERDNGYSFTSGQSYTGARLVGDDIWSNWTRMVPIHAQIAVEPIAKSIVSLDG